MVKYYYCPVCKKEIEPEERIRKPLESIEKVIWAIIIIGSVGTGLIPFLIYYIYFRTQKHCPNCYSKLAISNQPFEKPEEEEIEPKTPREKVLKKAGKKIQRKKEPEKEKKPKEEEKEEDKIFCPFCGTRLSRRTAKCPNCGTRIKDRIQN